MNIAAPILLVDDEPDTLLGLQLLLRREGLEPVESLADGRRVAEVVAARGAAAMVLDLNMPLLGGREILAWMRRNHPKTPVIVLTALQEVETAVFCMKEGAFDYLIKPVEADHLIACVHRALEVHGLRNQVDQLKGFLLGEALHCPEAFAPILTASPAMQSLFKYMEAIRHSHEPLLVTGETGTGKELFARAFHALRRPDGPFVAVNTAGLDDHMFADTLFGHRKGAFTGADTPREGLVARAEKGTLFLDEIGDLSEASQVKLLRLLQERKYEPLGQDISRNANVVFVAATISNLAEKMEKGRFRADLYYRLRAHQIHLPPLREHTGDLPLLVHHFLAEAAAGIGVEPPFVPRELFQLLATHHFPGNIRELRAIVLDAWARVGHGPLHLEVFREILGQGRERERWVMGATPLLSWPDGCPPPTLKEAENFLVEHAMEKAKGNQGIAAGLLGITRQALNQRLARARGRGDEA